MKINGQDLRSLLGRPEVKGRFPLRTPISATGTQLGLEKHRVPCGMPYPQPFRQDAENLAGGVLLASCRQRDETWSVSISC